jgi:MFS family permease
MAPKRSVLLALTDTHHGFFKGAARYVREYRWHVVADMTYTAKIPVGGRGDGILSFIGDRDDLAEFILSSGLPAVEISMVRNEINLPRVEGDSEMIGRLAAEHFLERGFRHFAWAPFPDDGVNAERYRGFANRLAPGTTHIIVAVALVCFVCAFLFFGLDVTEKRRLAVVAVLFVSSAMFWSGFEQPGSSLNLFAERYTQRTFSGFEIPSGWFQSLNPTFIISLAPRRLVGQTRGIWFLATSLGNLIAGLVAGQVSSDSGAQMSARYLQIVLMTLGVSGLLLVFAKPIQSLTKDVK